MNLKKGFAFYKLYLIYVDHHFLQYCRWLAKLEELIARIASRFSHYFEIMGFAGDVILSQGDGENDFANFGIEILVKYRSTEPLQKLNPHQQSGGERSVATALYMMALQVCLFVY